MMKPSAFYSLLKETVVAWVDDNAPTLGAALAYYGVFSVAPLLVLVLAIAGVLFGQDAAQGALVDRLGDVAGQPMAQAIQSILQGAANPVSTAWATVISSVTLFVGASAVFSQLQQSLNTIWKVQPRPGRAWLRIVRERALSFLVVLGVGALLLAALAVSAILAAVVAYLPADWPGDKVLWTVMNEVLSFALITGLFALVFKVLPDVQIPWSNVWLGAAVTSLLFAIGKQLIGWYLARTGVASSYGAAGSLAVVLVWVYYSSQVFLFGAEFTQVYSRRHGKVVAVARNAEPLQSPKPAVKSV
jgi:membrane protein